MTSEAVAPGSVIHHAETFGRPGYDAPTTCGRTEQPKPASDDWAYVTCEACWEKAPREESFVREADRLLVAQGVHHFTIKVVTPTFDAAVVEGTLPNGDCLRMEMPCSDADEAMLAWLRGLKTERPPSGGGGA